MEALYGSANDYLCNQTVRNRLLLPAQVLNRTFGIKFPVGSYAWSFSLTWLTYQVHINIHVFVQLLPTHCYKSLLEANEVERPPLCMSKLQRAWEKEARNTTRTLDEVSSSPYDRNHTTNDQHLIWWCTKVEISLCCSFPCTHAIPDTAGSTWSKTWHQASLHWPFAVCRTLLTDNRPAIHVKHRG